VYHLLNEFCNSELSAFYLDVLKDRLYTYPIAYKPGREYQRELYLARRSAQTAIYKITDALARLTAPLLSFTAEEVWQSLPGAKSSVHLTLFPTPESVAPSDTQQLEQDWKELLLIRTAALKALEAGRNEKLIGKALEASIEILIAKFNSSSRELLARYKLSLPELMNVSSVDLMDVPDSEIETPVGVRAKIATGTKCDRCWRYTDDVGGESKYPTVCLRCAEALDAIDFAPYVAAAAN
jgi:isoleucyl-tRNA synthetase